MLSMTSAELSRMPNLELVEGLKTSHEILNNSDNSPRGKHNEKPDDSPDDMLFARCSGFFIVGLCYKFNYTPDKYR